MDGKGLDITNLPIYGFFKPCPAVEIIAAMNLSVWHHIATGNGPGHEWYGDILIKWTGAQQATCISMPKPAGVWRLLVKCWKQRMNLPLMRSVKAFQKQTFRMEQLPPSLRERGREMFHSQ